MNRKAKRRRHEPAFKARVALEALKDIHSVQQIAQQYEVHPVQVSEWKKTMTHGADSLFESGRSGDAAAEFERERAELHAKIGQLSMEVDFLRKKSRQLGL